MNALGRRQIFAVWLALPGVVPNQATGWRGLKTVRKSLRRRVLAPDGRSSLLAGAAAGLRSGAKLGGAGEACQPSLSEPRLVFWGRRSGCFLRAPAAHPGRLDARDRHLTLLSRELP